jgi:hypothetical protein
MFGDLLSRKVQLSCATIDHQSYIFGNTPANNYTSIGMEIGSLSPNCKLQLLKSANSVSVSGWQ